MEPEFHSQRSTFENDFLLSTRHIIIFWSVVQHLVFFDDGDIIWINEEMFHTKSEALLSEVCMRKRGPLVAVDVEALFRQYEHDSHEVGIVVFKEFVTL